MYLKILFKKTTTTTNYHILFVPTIYFLQQRKEEGFILTMSTEEEGRCLRGVARGVPQVNSETGHPGESMLDATADEMVSAAIERRTKCDTCVCVFACARGGNTDSEKCF